MSDPPSPRTAAMSIQMRAMREHFERLLREQGEQFQQRVDELERRSQNSNDGRLVVMRMRGGVEGDLGKIIYSLRPKLYVALEKKLAYTRAKHGLEFRQT
jgi:hypothetical protein